METDAWQQKIDINSQLFKESSKFSFIQAIRLLEQNLKDKDGSFKKKIRARPRLSLDFPNSDIVDIQEDDDFIRLTVTFMGLYGESSPLPTFYTEMLLQEQKDDKSVMRDFIDIFNAPVYKTYFKVWLKNQLGIRLDEFNDTKVLDFLHLFSGMPKEHLRQKHQNSYSLLKYAGLNMHYPRSAEALRTLISDIIDNERVEIIQCIKQMAPIPQSQYCSLGQDNTTLDEDLHLGNKVKDRMGKFRIFIDDLDIKSFNELLPKTQRFDLLCEAVRLYIGESLDWDLQLTLRDDAFKVISLGEDYDSRLGLNTWLGSSKKTRTLFLDKNQYKVGYHDSK